MTLPTPQTSESEFERLYRHHVRDIARYVARRVPPESRDEVIANTFVAAWRKFHTASNPTLQWLYRIAFFEVSHEIRRLQRHRQLPVEPKPVDAESTSLETTDLVRSILERLTESERELIRLVHWEGQSREEVAQILGVSVNLVNVRLHRTHRRIEKRLSVSLNSMPVRPDQLEVKRL